LLTTAVVFGQSEAAHWLASFILNLRLFRCGPATAQWWAIIYMIIGIPIALLYGAEAMEQAFRQSGVQLPFSGTVAIIIGTLMAAVFLLVMAVLGGLIAVPLLEKRKNGATPPPPPAPGTGPGPYAA
jgi:prolipoprotein diacylglyceryltransferase